MPTEIRIVARKPKKATRSLSKLKHELDRLFSLKVRHRANKCYTCDKPGTPKTLQCGHFVPRQYLATRWDESNTRPQCVGCNIWGKGMILEFEERLKREIGVGNVESLKEKRKLLLKLNRSWYEEQIKIYTQELLDISK